MTRPGTELRSPGPLAHTLLIRPMTRLTKNNKSRVSSAGKKFNFQIKKELKSVLVASNIEQVLAATPHKAPTIRTPASHHENYPS